MAGRKQHFIPQSVQRAFEASRTSTKSQVLVFRKGKEPYATSTEGSAAERDFYSKPLVDGRGALDDRITDFENEHLTSMLRELRGVQRGPVDAELAAITVAHLAFRTAHLRGSLQSVAVSAVNQMKALIEDPDAIRRFAGVDAASTDSRLMEMVREDLSRLGLDAWPQKDRNAIERMVIFRVRERFDDLFLQSKDSVRAVLDSVGTNMAGSVAKAHARVLSESLVPSDRVRALRALEWEIIPSDDKQNHFILPDCVVIATSDATNYQPLSMLSIAEAATVVMPLSSRQLLVGSESPARIDLDRINADFARCSLEFFISSRRDDGTLAIRDLIGGRTTGLVLDMLDPVEVAPPPTPHARPMMAKVPIRAPIGRAGDAMKSILTRLRNEALDPVAADRVESITVSANMAAALEAVWKRAPTPAEVEGAVLGTVEAVKVGADFKCRVIIPRSLAQALLQPTDSKGQLAATRMVKLHLGRVYYFDCWARRDPAMVGQRPGLPLWDQIAARLASRAGSHYFGGLASARHELEPLPGGDRLEDMAVTFRRCFAGLRQARQQYFAHRNVDQLLADALGPIDALLVAIATLFGFLEAKDCELARDSDAGDALSEAGLWAWALLLAKDLRQHYATRDQWSSPSSLEPLVGHIERILWTVGVIVSKTDSGHWIDVVDDARMPVLENVLQA